MTDNYILAAIGEWNKDLFDKYKKDIAGDWHFVSTPSEIKKI